MCDIEERARLVGRECWPSPGVGMRDIEEQVRLVSQKCWGESWKDDV